MDDFLKTVLAAISGGLLVVAGQYLAEHFRRRARPELYGDLLFKERLRAHAEIAAALIDILTPRGRLKLSESMGRNILFLNATTVRLINEILFHPPAGKFPEEKFFQLLLALDLHLRDDLSLPAIEREVLKPVLEQTIKQRSQQRT